MTQTTLEEAISRMFAAEHRAEQLEKDLARLECRRAQMKRDAGYPDNISFDVVWADALRAIKASKEAASNKEAWHIIGDKHE